MTANALLTRLGEASERTEEADGGESWTYYRSLRWAYVIVCVGVCLPLGIPVGRESWTFHVRDGVVESADSVKTRDVGHLCGIIPGLCWNVGCQSFRR